MSPKSRHCLLSISTGEYWGEDLQILAYCPTGGVPGARNPNSSPLVNSSHNSTKSNLIMLHHASSSLFKSDSNKSTQIFPQ